MRPLRVYLDTCVFGGAYDLEFANATQTFFAQVRMGRFHLVVSALVQQELQNAPGKVQELFTEMLTYTTVMPFSNEAIELQQAYLEAGVLTSKWADDALHVAMATVTNCSYIVSWNFKHIVHSEKIPRYNAINEIQGYRPLAIYSPLEVIHYEEGI
ncbi:MAG: type II toxin-antitoxin system VapC family toxin [bacterium]